MPLMLHLPTGFPRTLRWNDAAGITHLAHRCWQAVLAGLCRPTARAVAERYDVNKDTAAKALKSLESSGLLLRWRKSAGRGIWIHFVVATDEPFAWHDDSELRARLDTVEKATMERARARLHLDDADALSPVPPPRQPEQPSQDVVTCPASSDVPNKFSTFEISTPNPTPVDNPQPADRFTRRQPVDRFTRRLLKMHRTAPELDPHIAPALAVLHDLGFAPLERVRHAETVARALHSGRTLGAVIHFLTDGMGSARDRLAVLRFRLRRLHDAMTTTESPSRSDSDR